LFSAIAFALFALVCTVLAFRRHPIYGLYFYLATTYVHPPSRWWNYMLPDLRWALLSAAICVLAIAFHRGRLDSRRPFWLSRTPAVILCLYAAWMWVQTPWALDLDQHLNGATIFAKYILAFWFFYRIVDTKESIRDVMFFHAAGCAMLGLMARLSDREFGRVEGVGGPGIDDANALGMFLCTGAVICLCLLLSQRGWRRLLALIMLPLILEGFVVTGSRGAFLGLATGTLVLLFARSVAYNKAVLALGVLVAVVAVVAVDQKFVDRMFTIGDVASESVEAEMSARSRTAIMRAQLEMARDHPLGAGHRGTVPLSPLYMDRMWLDGGGRDSNAGRASHNSFLSALVEQGVPGGLLFLSLVGWLLWTIWRVRAMRRRNDEPELVMLASGLCGGLTVVFVAGLATDYLTTEVQFWFCACLASAMNLLSPASRGAAGVTPSNVAARVGTGATQRGS
jgi:O-antigen ligase